MLTSRQYVLSYYLTIREFFGYDNSTDRDKETETTGRIFVMRVSMRSGRIGSAKHNDRSFDINKAEHINELHTELNEVRLYQVFSLADDDNDLLLETSSFATLEEYELEFYRMAYQEQCDITNANYINQGHPERCKSPDDLYHGKLTRPEEMILQIGDMHDDIPRDVFISCVDEYIERFESWNNEHGQHGQILDVAYHFDEQSPHAHIRRVWDYTDRNNVYRLGQNKALEQAGVELPNPSKKPSRYNNRKMTFDAIMRGKWQDICKAHGFDIVTEPRINKKHKQKAQYIADCLNDKIDDLQNNVDILERSITELRREKELKRLDLYLIHDELNTAQQDVFDKEDELKYIDGQINAKKLEFEAMEQQLNSRIDELRESIDKLTGSAQYEYLKREFKEYTMSMSRDGVVALYKDGTIRDVGLNPYGGFDFDILEDKKNGLCTIGKFVDERKAVIPERLLNELIGKADHTMLSADLIKFIEREHVMKSIQRKSKTRR